MITNITTEIKIDLYGETKLYEVSAKQYDKKTRIVSVALLNNGAEYKIPIGALAVINVKKPDGKFCYNQCKLSDNHVLIELTSQMLAAAGTATADIELRNREGTEVLTSASFTIEIEPSMRNEKAIESSNEFTIFDKLLDDISRKQFEWQDEEAKRYAAEENRLSAEETRKLREADRVKAEQGRVAMQSTLTDEEAKRYAAEENRLSAEETRKLREADRVKAEQGRVAMQSTFTDEEAKRYAAEENRLSAEETRILRENDRVNAESARKSLGIGSKMEKSFNALLVNLEGEKNGKIEFIDAQNETGVTNLPIAGMQAIKIHYAAYGTIACVYLFETYPVSGRIWTKSYKLEKWSEWKNVADTSNMISGMRIMAKNVIINPAGKKYFDISIPANFESFVSCVTMNGNLGLNDAVEVACSLLSTNDYIRVYLDKEVSTNHKCNIMLFYT